MRYVLAGVPFVSIVFVSLGPRPVWSLVLVAAMVAGYGLSSFIAAWQQKPGARGVQGVWEMTGLAALLLIVGGSALVSLWPVRPQVGLFTVFERVEYEGHGVLDAPRGPWKVTHRLTLHPDQVQRSVGTILEMQAEHRDGPFRTIGDILDSEGWSEAGLVDGRPLFERRDTIPRPSAWFRIAQADRLVVPTLGLRYDGGLMLWPVDDARIMLAIPSRTVVETGPPPTRHERALSGQTEAMTLPIRRAEDRLAFVEVSVAGPLFRHRGTHWIAKVTVSRLLLGVLALVAALFYFELRRRLGEPGVKKLFDSIGVPDRSKD